MAPRAARHRYSYDEYLAYERDSGMKHEYDGGEIIAIAGGSRRHNALASRISTALDIAGPRLRTCAHQSGGLRLRRALETSVDSDA